MKKSTRIVSAIMACVIASASLVGCGTEKVSNDDNLTVKMWSRVTSDSSQLQIDLENYMIEKLEEKFPDISVVIERKSVGADYRQEYDKALMAGVAPDIFTEFSYTDIPTRIENGTIADITSLVSEWDMKNEDKVLTAFDDAISKDGKWYAIPRSAYTQAMLINKKVLAQAGENPEALPTTWDEFAAMGQRITDFNVPRIGYELVGRDWCAWPFTAWVWSAGGEMVTPNGDGTYKLSFNDAPGVDAAVFMNEMVWKYKMTQKNILCSMDDINKDVQNGTACFAWSTLGSAVTKDSMDRYGLTYDDYTMSTMPVKDASIKNPALAGGEVITFNPKADEETLKAAFKVASYIYYDEEYLTGLWQIQRDGGWMDISIPARSDLYEKKIVMIR